MSYCIFCLRTLAAPVPTGALPLCAECSRQLAGMPPADRMQAAVAGAKVIEQQRFAEAVRRLSIQLGDMVDAARERAD